MLSPYVGLARMANSSVGRQWAVLLISVAAWGVVPIANLWFGPSGAERFFFGDLSLLAGILSAIFASASYVAGTRMKFSEAQRLGRYGVSLARLYLQVIGVTLIASLIYWLTV